MKSKITQDDGTTRTVIKIVVCDGCGLQWMRKSKRGVDTESQKIVVSHNGQFTKGQETAFTRGRKYLDFCSADCCVQALKTFTSDKKHSELNQTGND